MVYKFLPVVPVTVPGKAEAFWLVGRGGSGMSEWVEVKNKRALASGHYRPSKCFSELAVFWIRCDSPWFFLPPPCRDLHRQQQQSSYHQNCLHASLGKQRGRRVLGRMPDPIAKFRKRAVN